MKATKDCSEFPLMGIPEIDDEHLGLLRCLKRLELFIENGHGFAASIDAVQQLKDYASNHFTHEEQYLAERGFPNLSAHIEQHQQITNYITKLYDQLIEGKEIESSLIQMMQSWIVKHIGVEDMEFAIYFQTTRCA